MSNLMLRINSADHRLLETLVRRRNPVVDITMRGVTRVGDVRVIVPLAVALALGWVPELRTAGRVGLLSLVLSHLVVQLAKRRVCRPRPVAFAALVDPEDHFSFPSGHATAALSVALPLGLTFTGAPGAIVLGLGLTVGLSRCWLGVHYPGDVVVGWALAILTVLGVSIVI